jgi:hypothetical protein
MRGLAILLVAIVVVSTENPIRVDEVTESRELAG